MDLTPEQEQELARRYEARFQETGDTLTFHQAYEVRHAYFEELRAKEAAGKSKQAPAVAAVAST